MQYAIVQKILGLLLASFSLALLPPILIAWLSNDGELMGFLIAFSMIIIIAMLLWLPVKNVSHDLKLRDGFIIVVLFWISLGISGAIPLYLSETLNMSISDAAFESISALTTTGATVITNIDVLPKSILFYRQELQWLGGIGIVVLAVAILPVLGTGGMRLYRAETPESMKGSKLTPRIKETARALWYIYLGLTISCALLYWLAGMTAFDAIAHSFSTVSIGGFSTHDASIGYFDSRLIEAIAVAFMLLSGINFTLHFFAWRNSSLTPYWQNAEFRAYITILSSVCGITCLYLLLTNSYDDNFKAIVDAIFQTVSIATTTGYTTTTYQDWPEFLPVLLLFASFAGACAGSTGGGLKVIRVLLLYKQGTREIKRLLHPSAVIPIKIDNKPVQESTINAIWGFFAAYVTLFTLLMLVLLATGLEQVTAFSAMAACINNLGPGLGNVSTHYGDINNAAKWTLCFAMLLGRLELFTLLVLLSPAFWKK